MQISPARKIAYDVLRRVEEDAAYASEALHAELGAEVSSADAALATEIAMGVLRWRRLLDFLLERHLRKPVSRLDLSVAIALRTGLYQLRFLRRIPAHAAVYESAEMVKRGRKSSAASLVTAVLRRAAGEAGVGAETFLAPSLRPAERLGILHSHPSWMVERWLARFGETSVVALLKANNSAPRVTCVMQDMNRYEETIRELEKAGLRIETGRLLKAAFSAGGGSATGTDAFRRGAISIQDEASQAVPLLLGARSGDFVLDLCAAPGGKTSALIRAAGDSGLVVAADLHEHRLRVTQTHFERLRLRRAHFVVLDAARGLPFRAGFGRILVDAPCSGTGTLARHPEIRWRLQPEKLREFHGLQTRLLRNALACLAPGGRLVYSTCSIEPEENEEVVAEVLREACGDFASIRIVPPSETEALLIPHLAQGMEAGTLFTDDGFFRTSPAVHQTEGFFAAVLERP